MYRTTVIFGDAKLIIEKTSQRGLQNLVQKKEFIYLFFPMDSLYQALDNQIKS
jgi:hypothetical protein